MVKTPNTRHSKSRREPVTIELEPGEVSRIAEETEAAGGPGAEAAAQQAAQVSQPDTTEADAPAAELDRWDTTDGEHGRIEVRRHAVSREVAWLSSARRFPGEPRFPGLAAIAMVEAEVERNVQTSRERRYFLSSAALDARLFAHAVRCHWHVENRLHWVMDVVSHDDLCRLRSGCGPQNMAIVRHIAMNLLRAAPGKQSFAVRRKKASWNTDYLEAIIRQEA